MRCPKCGLELEDGYLYCSSCGEEIRIVPDFEPEIEYELDETLSTIVVEMGKHDGSKTQEVEEIQNNLFRSKRLKQGAFAGLLFLFLTCICTVGYFYYKNMSYSYQLVKAQEYAKTEKYDIAIKYLEKAYEINGENSDLLFLMADYYYIQEKYDFAVYSLNQIIENKEQYTEEDLETAYNEIIGIYNEQKKYEEINTLLLEVEESAIVSMFQKYMANAPEFSYPAGVYEEVLPLKLSANTSGSIHYTIDGSTPNEKSTTYITPIFLEPGNYQINAFFVNDYGIKSPIATANYRIDLPVPQAPDVFVISGNYDTPELIRVEKPKEGDVYYTADGTMPTISSAIYSAPIPMPMGQSTYQFVTISDDGIASDITVRQYNLTLQTKITTDQAVMNVIHALMREDVLLDEEGRMRAMSGRNVYRYNSVVTIDGEADYFIIHEYYEDATNTLTRTERIYAVNIQDGSTYRVTYNEYGNIILISL